jgi:hypothetical protein
MMENINVFTARETVEKMNTILMMDLAKMEKSSFYMSIEDGESVVKWDIEYYLADPYEPAIKVYAKYRLSKEKVDRYYADSIMYNIIYLIRYHPELTDVE